MKLERIITLASSRVRLRFLAMERSLRATGCDLPLWVIPYNADYFPLPENATWWEMPDILSWLRGANACPALRKYQCFTTANYQFVDSDVCFLRNPGSVLAPHGGFVTSCGHWHNPEQTYTAQSRAFVRARTTTWQTQVFNSGQFACDRVLYSPEELKRAAEAVDCVETCVRWMCDQPGLNLLVWKANVPVRNLTLPPVCMESTWAGDYPDDYRRYWTNALRQPYLIHWAGTAMEVPRPINDIFLNFLTNEERRQWQEELKQNVRRHEKARTSLRARARRIRNSARAILSMLRGPATGKARLQTAG